MSRKIPYEKLKAYGHDETTVNRAVGQLVYDGVMDPSDVQILQQIIRMKRAERGERISDPDDDGVQKGDQHGKAKEKEDGKARRLEKPAERGAGSEKAHSRNRRSG